MAPKKKTGKVPGPKRAETMELDVSDVTLTTNRPAPRSIPPRSPPPRSLPPRSRSRAPQPPPLPPRRANTMEVELEWLLDAQSSDAQPTDAHGKQEPALSTKRPPPPALAGKRALPPPIPREDRAADAGEGARSAKPSRRPGPRSKAPSRE